MSFQGYLTTIKAKTGNGPEDFRRLAAEKGFTDGAALKPGVKAAISWPGSSRISTWDTGTPWQSTRCSRAANPRIARRRQVMTRQLEKSFFLEKADRGYEHYRRRHVN